MNRFKHWWKVQKEHFTAWPVHEKIGDIIGLPTMIIACIIGLIFMNIKVSGYIFFPLITFAYFLGNLNGYEICQNKLEQGRKAIKLWLDQKVIDSLVDEWVASYKSGLLILIFIKVVFEITK